eukprot:2157543-Pleurochrysis_carterae.AAC.1
MHIAHSKKGSHKRVHTQKFTPVAFHPRSLLHTAESARARLYAHLRTCIYAHAQPRTAALSHLAKGLARRGFEARRVCAQEGDFGAKAGESLQASADDLPMGARCARGAQTRSSRRSRRRRTPGRRKGRRATH